MDKKFYVESFCDNFDNSFWCFGTHRNWEEQGVKRKFGDVLKRSSCNVFVQATQ